MLDDHNVSGHDASLASVVLDTIGDGWLLHDDNMCRRDAASAYAALLRLATLVAQQGHER